MIEHKCPYDQQRLLILNSTPLLRRKCSSDDGFCNCYVQQPGISLSVSFVDYK